MENRVEKRRRCNMGCAILLALGVAVATCVGTGAVRAADNPALGIGEPNTNPNGPPPPPPCPSPTCDCPGGSGSPVYVMSGALFKNFVDLQYNLGTRLEFSIWRSYNGDDFYVGYFGRGVSSTLEMMAIPTFKGGLADEIVIVHWPDGRRSTFTRQPDDSYTSSLGVYESLAKVPGGFALRERMGLVYEFDDDTRLTRIVDPDGNDVTVSYDANGRPTTITLFNGRPIDIVYNANGFVDTITDFAGRSVSYEYDAAGNLTGYTDAESHTTTYEYDDGRFARIINPLGQTIFSVTYDTQGRVRDLIDNEGSFTYTYNNGNTFKQDNQYEAGAGWRYFYNAQGQITRIDRPDGVTINHVFNGMAQQTTQGTGTGPWQLVYDSQNNIVQTTDPTGGVTSFTYEPNFNQLETVTNHNGIVTRYEYGPTGLRTREQRAFGLPEEIEQSWTYNADGTTASHTDFRGNTTSFEYDANNYLTRRVDRENKVWLYQYDALGRLLMQTDPMSNVTTFSHDNLDRVVSNTDAASTTLTHTYDPAGRRVATTDRRGNVTNFEYDAFGRLTAIVGASTGKGATRPRTEMEYDSHGWLTKLTDPNGAVTDYEYNRVGFMTRRIDRAAAGDLETVWVVNGEGHVTSETDTAAGVTTFTYDAMNRLTNRTRTLGPGRTEVETYTYDFLGRRATETLANGQAKSYGFDVLDRPETVTDQIGLVSTTESNENSRPTRFVINGEQTTIGYDNEDRPETYTDNEGRTTTAVYDDRGLLLRVDSPGGRAYLYGYDPVGSLTSALLELGGQTFEPYTYEYDANRNRTAIINPGGVRTEMDYDALNRMTARRSAAGTGQERTESFAYDLAGNLTRRTLSDGSVIDYGYDDRNRLTSIDYPGTEYDATYTYGADGRLASASNPDSTTTYTYSFQGRTIQQNTDGKVTTVTTDVAARTATIQYPSGRSVVRHYDVRDRLTSIDVNGAQVAGYAYDLADRLTSRTYANTTNTDYGWDSRGLVLSVSHDAGGSPFFNKTYGIDGDALTRFERDQLAATQSKTFDYDGANRLIEHRVGTLDFNNQIPSPTTEIDYAYDAQGRLTTRTDDGVPSVRSYDDLDQVAAVDGTAYVFDGRGNLVDDGANTYAYDFENRLVRVTRQSDNTDVLQIKYDALGNRVETTYENGDVVRHYSVLQNVIEERNAADQVQHEFVYRRQQSPAVMYASGTPYFYHEDGRQNVIGLTDAGGSEVDEYGYTPFGRTSDVSGVGNPYTWAGQRRDPNGWSHLRYRSYSPELAQFVQTDPISTPMTAGHVYRNVMGLSADAQNRGIARWTPAEISRQMAGASVEPGIRPARIPLNPSPSDDGSNLFTIQNQMHVGDMGQPGMRFMGLQTPDRQARYGYGGNNPVDRFDPDGEIWTPASGGISACLFSGCLLSGCLGSGCAGSGCASSTCFGSVCATSGCGGSGCFGSGCALSGCGGSLCAGSACAGSGCLGSFCAGSACAASGCIGSVCGTSVCGGSICIGSACGVSYCGGSGCVLSICGVSGCGVSICGGSGCIISVCTQTACSLSACSASNCQFSNCATSCGGANCDCSTYKPDFLSTPEEMLAGLDIRRDRGGGVTILIASHAPQQLTLRGRPAMLLEANRVHEIRVTDQTAFEISLPFVGGEDAKRTRIEFAQLVPPAERAHVVARADGARPAAQELPPTESTDPAGRSIVGLMVLNGT